MAFTIENNVLLRYREEPGYRKVMIPDGVKEIGNNAFLGRTQITNVLIPSSVQSIGEAAFAHCRNLRELIIPEGVWRIGANAFEGCCRLTHVTIPRSLLLVGNNIFMDTYALHNLTIYGVRWESIHSVCNDFHNVMCKIRSKDLSTACIAFDEDVVAAVGLWMKNGDLDAERYITEHLDDILPFLIKNQNLEIIQKLLDSGKIITKNNIDKCIECAIVYTQNGGDIELQTMLIRHKAEQLDFGNPAAGLKL